MTLMSMQEYAIASCRGLDSQICRVLVRFTRRMGKMIDASCGSSIPVRNASPTLNVMFLMPLAPPGKIRRSPITDDATFKPVVVIMDNSHVVIYVVLVFWHECRGV